MTPHRRLPARLPRARRCAPSSSRAAGRIHACVAAARRGGGGYRILDRESGLNADGVEGDPGADREVFDPDKAYAQGSRDPASFGGGGARKALLSSLVQLLLLEDEKARAKRAPAKAVASLCCLP